MAFSFKNFIWGLLPDYFSLTDSYKDGNDEGIFQRYSKNFDYYLDDEVYPFIKDVLDILSAKDTEAKFLPYLAYMFGDTPLTKDTAANRNLIRWAATLHRLKGSRPSYRMIFNLFGYGVDVIETWGRRPVRYDNYDYRLNTYDSHYYDTGCPGCTTITLAYYHLDTPLGNLSANITASALEAIQSLLCLITPIDVTVGSFIKVVRVADTFSVTNSINELTPFGATCSVATNLDDAATPGAFNAPLGLSANHTYDLFELNWAAPIPQVDPVVGYEIEYFESTADPLTNWAQLSTTSLTIQQAVIGGIDYDFRVRALYDKGKSEWVYLLSSHVPPPVCSLASNIQVVNYI